MIAERWGLSRAQVDEFSVASHEKAAAAREEGRFEGQLAPVALPDGTVVSADEGIRPGTTTEALGKLKTVFKPEGGVITASNSSQISDGAAALLMMTGDKARQLGLTPIARVHTAVLAGADPVIMLTAPSRPPRRRCSGRGSGWTRSAPSRSTRRSRRSRWPGWPRSAPTPRRSTPTAARSPWATRWVARAPAS